MTFDFSTYEPAARTARFEPPIRGALVPRSSIGPVEDGQDPDELVEGQPWIEVRYAGEGNKGYMNGVARMTVKASRGTRKAPTAERVMKAAAENIAQDRDLYPDHVLVSWGNMPGPDRQPVPFTKAAARDLCAQLPEWIFLRLRAYASNPVNFVEDEDAEKAVDEEEVREAAGN